MIKFRKIKRFVGTIKKYQIQSFLQYSDDNNTWQDILDITSLPDIFNLSEWENKIDEENYEKAQKREYLGEYR